MVVGIGDLCPCCLLVSLDLIRRNRGPRLHADSQPLRLLSVLRSHLAPFPISGVGNPSPRKRVGSDTSFDQPQLEFAQEGGWEGTSQGREGLGCNFSLAIAQFCNGTGMTGRGGRVGAVRVKGQGLGEEPVQGTQHGRWPGHLAERVAPSTSCPSSLAQAPLWPLPSCFLSLCLSLPPTLILGLPLYTLFSFLPTSSLSSLPNPFLPFLLPSIPPFAHSIAHPPFPVSIFPSLNTPPPPAPTGALCVSRLCGWQPESTPPHPPTRPAWQVLPSGPSPQHPQSQPSHPQPLLNGPLASEDSSRVELRPPNSSPPTQRSFSLWTGLADWWGWSGKWGQGD